MTGILFGMSGCSKECKSNADCESGMICVDDKCVPAEEDGGPGTGGDLDGDTDVDGDTDTDMDTDADVDSDADTDTDADGDTETESGSGGTEPPGSDLPSDIDTDTTTTECAATLPNGAVCGQSCQCLSNHCDNGFCCNEGVCCGDTSDCTDDLCAYALCDGNHSCSYAIGDMLCGANDTAGSQYCFGEQVCDGSGGCLPVQGGDCGLFTPAGYECNATVAVATCNTGCTPQNQDETCVENAECVEGVCVATGLFPHGASCTVNSECASGYCDNGFCCPSGECCGSTTDCSGSLCRNRVCGPDHSCLYNQTGFSCGMEDTVDGETCNGASRCDGAGNCVILTRCTGAYLWDSQASPPYTCSAGEIRETCHETCSATAECVDGYECDVESGACVWVGALDGEPCTEHAQCSSGYCSNGYCCVTGTCCQYDFDCPGDLCRGDSYCAGDAICRTATAVTCGAEDTAGNDTCTGDHLCDGEGNCVLIDTCDDAYASQQNGYTCATGVVTERCFNECYLEGFEDPRCNAGFICTSAECVPVGLYPDGYACDTGDECESGYCEGNVCCASGECCQSAADCDENVCVVAYCGTDSVCDYRNIQPCGAADTVDEPGDGTGVCEGGSRCDAEGSCVSVTACDGAYASTGQYLCATGDVEEECYTSCSDGDQCNDGYYCSAAGACTAKIPNGGTGCTRNQECESNYCTTSTGVCCDDGVCCANDGDCGSAGCNPDTNSCLFTCNDGGDNDALCAFLGDFHCDNGVCNEDLSNGEGLCNESSDCLSGYCDPSTNICCAGGACCGDDEDCEGGLCGPGGQCAGTCGENDGLCGEAYHCDSDTCIADILSGQGVCDEDSDCASGNCTEATGICCAPGDTDCCNSAAHCDDGNPCTLDGCDPFFHCFALDKSEGEHCDDDLYCNGEGRCDADGQCIPINVPCQTVETCREQICNEDADSCEWQVIVDNIGTPCSEALFCLNGRQLTCTEGGLCTDPDPAGGGPCPEPSDSCSLATCDEANDSCGVEALPDGTSCNDGNPCTGNNQCYDGTCVVGPRLPCDDGNPCTDDPCTNNGGTHECGAHTAIADGQPCNDHFACFGDAPVCRGGACISLTEDVCGDDMGVCTIHACQEVYYGDVDCGDPIYNTGFDVECGTTTPLDEGDMYIFATRENYSYGDLCPGSFPGMEAVIPVFVTGSGEVTVSIENTMPSSVDIAIMDMATHCDAMTCQGFGINSYTFTTGGGNTTLVLEVMDYLLPTSFDLVVSACP